MKKWMQKLTSMFIGSALVLSLSGRALAEEIDSEPPEEPKTQIVEPSETEKTATSPETEETEEPGETDGQEEGSPSDAPTDEDGEAAPGTTAAQDGLGTEEDGEEGALASAPAIRSAAPLAAAAMDATGAPADDTGTPADDTGTPADDTGSGTVTVNGVEVGGNEDVWFDASPMQDGYFDSHWSAQDLALVLINAGGQSISAGSADLTIAATGLNHIQSLTGTGNINLAGTGVVLIDQVDLGETGKLQTSVNGHLYEEGAVAVFLKQDDGSYKLISEETTGMLDERYSLPDGTSLVLPAGSELILNSLAALYEGTDRTNADYYSGDQTEGVTPTESQTLVESAATLNIGSGSVVVVEKGASIQMPYTVSISKENSLILPKMEIADQGGLKVNGTLEGGYFELASAANVTGSGQVKPNVVHMNTANDMAALQTAADALGWAAESDGKFKVGYADLVDLIHKLLGDCFQAFTPDSFVLVSGGETTVIGKDSPSTAQFEVGDFDFSAWDSSPYTGTGITSTNVSVTGTGVLGGGIPLGSFLSPKAPTTILTGSGRSTPAEPETPAAGAEQGALRVVITEKTGYYNLAVFSAAGQITDLGGMSVTARMTWELPADARGDAYAVFRNADGSLRAIQGRYDPQTNTLRFDSPLVGDFVVVCFSFDGELFTPAFYEALAQLDAVKLLLSLS